MELAMITMLSNRNARPHVSRSHSSFHPCLEALEERTLLDAAAAVRVMGPEWASAGDTITYTVDVLRFEPENDPAITLELRAVDTSLDQLIDETYTATSLSYGSGSPPGSATGFTPSGRGHFDDRLTIPSGSFVRYSVTGTIPSELAGPRGGFVW